MNTIAFCCWSYQSITKRAAGVTRILTSPPITILDFKPEMIQGADLLYLKLHGLPAQAYLYGDGWTTAVSANQIATADLTGCTVFAAVCHLPDSPMLQAFFNAGARAVIAGHGSNYASRTRVYGADLLGLTIRKLMQLHIPPHIAYRLAIHRIKRAKQDRYTRDTLEFCYHPRTSPKGEHHE
jgi:hypothetical protein